MLMTLNMCYVLLWDNFFRLWPLTTYRCLNCSVC